MTPGKQFKKDFTASVVLAGPEQERLLDLAANVLDEVAELTRRIEKDGLIITGSTGQQVAHPLLKERRAARAEFAKLIRDLSPDEPVRSTSNGSKAGTALANARWNR